MADSASPSPLDRVERRPNPLLRLGWLPAAIGLLVILWIGWHNVFNRTVIDIQFDASDGLKVGTSKLRYRGTEIGTVSGITLTPDRSRAIIEVTVRKDVVPLFTDHAEFWVDRATTGSPGVRDITMIPGLFELGRPELRTFIGLEQPPVLQSDMPGHVYLLRVRKLGGIWLGAPVVFRDLHVGQVLGWDIGAFTDSMVVHVFVRAPFDRYVNDQTKFWRAEVVQYSGNQVTGFQATKAPGIEFEPGDASSPIAAENMAFPLYDTQSAVPTDSKPANSNSQAPQGDKTTGSK
jgi:paraquat-inducible protein B